MMVLNCSSETNEQNNFFLNNNSRKGRGYSIVVVVSVVVYTIRIVLKSMIALNRSPETSE